MTIIKSKPYFRFIIIALLFLTYWVFSNGAEKLVYLADIDVVSSLGKANVQAALDAKGITVSRITRLIVRAGIVGSVVLLLGFGGSIYHLNKRGIHWLNCLSALLLLLGFNYISSRERGWHSTTEYLEVPAYLFQSRSYLYFLINGLLYIGIAILMYYLCLLYIRTMKGSYLDQKTPNTGFMQ